MAANPGNAYVVTITEFGPADIFTRTLIEPAQPGPGEILAKTIAIGANPLDYKMRDGSSGLCAKFTPSTVPGHEAASEVVAVGEGMDSFAPGDRVFGMCGFDDFRGTYVTHNVFPTDSVVRTPDSLDDVTAAGLAPVGVTTTVAVNQLVKVRSGDTVFIHGAGGGVGQLMTQLAVTRGATVLVSASSHHHEKLVGFGTQHVGYTAGDVFEVVRQQFPEGVDVVLDGVYFDTFLPLLDVLASGGRIAVLPSLVDLAPARECGVEARIPIISNDTAIYADLTDRVVVGEILLSIGLAKNLTEVAEVHRILEDGHAGGKIVMTVE